VQISASEGYRDSAQRKRNCGGNRLYSAIRKRPHEIEWNNTRTDSRTARPPRPRVRRRPQWLSSRWWPLQSLAGTVCNLVQPFDTHVTDVWEIEGPNELILPNSLTVFLPHPREHLTYPSVNVLNDEVYTSLKPALSQIRCPFPHSCIIPQYVHCFWSYCDNTQDWARLYSSDHNLVNQSAALYCCENLLECCFTTFAKFKSMVFHQITAFAPRYTTKVTGQIPVLRLLLDYYYYYHYRDNDHRHYG
jgi:hypothetical protein